MENTVNILYLAEKSFCTIWRGFELAYFKIFLLYNIYARHLAIYFILRMLHSAKNAK